MKHTAIKKTAMQHTTKLALLVLFWGTLFCGTLLWGPQYVAATPLHELPKHKYAFWKAAYHQVEARDNINVAVAEEIFARVRAASNISFQHPIRLLVTRQNPIDSLLTISLEDGTVVLSRHALETILAEKYGRHKLAFVFGHELAHIENNIKLSHLQPELRDETKLQHISYFMQPKITSDDATPRIDAAVAEELLADKLGVLNMIMAGFNPGYIYKEDCRSSFFARWESLLDNYVSGRLSVNTQDRCALVAKELALLSEKGRLFDIGLHFLAAGYFQDAVNAFEEMLNTYKGREIYLNLGAAYHKLAINDYMATEYDRPLPFQCSVLIDPLFRASVRSGAEKNPKRFRDNIEKAIAYYKIAIEKDPAYSSASANIGCAYILAGNANFAMGYLQQALEYAPDDAMLLNNYAITAYHLDKPDTAQQFIRKALALQEHPAFTYNLGVLTARKNNTESARKWFAQFDLINTQDDWLRNVSREGYVDNRQRRARLPLENIGGAKPGMALAEIKRKFAPLDEYKSLIENLPVLNQFANGVNTLSIGDQIVIVIAGEQHDGSSELNIRIGDSLEQLTSQYGKPDEIIATSHGRYLKFHDRQIGFFIDNNKVNKWMVYLTP